MRKLKRPCPVCRMIAKDKSFVSESTLEAVESAGSYDDAVEYLKMQVGGPPQYKGAIGLHIRHYYGALGIIKSRRT